MTAIFSAVIDRRYSLIRAAQLFLELRFPFVERLQAKLPAVQLDAELIDITGDLGALRLILFNLTLEVGEVGVRLCVDRCTRRNRWHWSWFAALLAVQRHSFGGGVHDKGRGTMNTGEGNVGRTWR